MFNLFFKKQRQIELLIYRYLDNFRLAQKFFAEALDTYIREFVSGNFDFLTVQTHKFESKADDIREEINELMYGKALIPESREDIMELLELIDSIPRLFEHLLHMIQAQKLVIPAFLVPEINELIRTSLESCELMTKQVEVLFNKSGSIRALISRIDQNESHCDHIEHHLVAKVFDSDIDPFQKLQLKEMVLYMGEISDQADRVSKRVNIVSLKRLV
ncbi:MAG: DUF47 family protein [Pseudomonadota bacterium]